MKSERFTFGMAAADGGGMRRKLALAILGSLGLFACAHLKPVGPEEVKAHSFVRVTLDDETVYEINSVSNNASDGVLCGRPKNCQGPSCEEVEQSQCIANERIKRIDKREISQSAVAGGIAGVAAGTLLLGTIAVVAMSNSGSHGSSSGGSYPSSSSSSSSGSGSQQGGYGSCPHLYSWDGSRFVLDSGTYGLSWLESVQRTDFDRLDHLVEDGGEYRFRLANELDETEHTDLVRLHVIDHPAGTRIVPSAKGVMHTFRAEALPLEVRDLRGKDAMDLVSTKDDREWTSDVTGRDMLRTSDARDGLRIRFAKPRDAKEAKLRIAGHSTLWAGKMLEYFVAHRGERIETWLDSMNHDASQRSAFDAFLVREGMLNVRVKTKTGWETRGTFWAAGPEIVKEEAFALRVDDVAGMGEDVEIELESATDFWSIDAVSMAYGGDEKIVDTALAPLRARMLDGRDLGRDLGKTFDAIDGARLDTVKGDVAELAFAAPPPPKPGLTRSFVVETAGYYVPDTTPAPDADRAVMENVMQTPFAASRLSLAFRLTAARAR